MIKCYQMVGNGQNGQNGQNEEQAPLRYLIQVHPADHREAPPQNGKSVQGTVRPKKLLPSPSEGRRIHRLLSIIYIRLRAQRRPGLLRKIVVLRHFSASAVAREGS